MNIKVKRENVNRLKAVKTITQSEESLRKIF